MVDCLAVVRDGDPPSKRALVSSALRLFVAKGIGETTVREVAKDAGVSNPAIFKFFESRDELALAVFERSYERLAEALAPTDAIAGFEARLRAIVAVCTEFMDRDLNAFLFVTEQLRVFWPRASRNLKRRPVLRMLHDLFQLGRAEGRVSADHDRHVLVAATIGTMAQVGRALYFGEIKGQAARLAPELERLFARMSW